MTQINFNTGEPLHKHAGMLRIQNGFHLNKPGVKGSKGVKEVKTSRRPEAGQQWGS